MRSMRPRKREHESDGALGASARTGVGVEREHVPCSGVMLHRSISVIAILVLQTCTASARSADPTTPPAVVAPRAAAPSPAIAEVEGVQVSVLGLHRPRPH